MLVKCLGMISGDELLLLLHIVRYYYYPHFVKKWKVSKLNLTRVIYSSSGREGIPSQIWSTQNECGTISQSNIYSVSETTNSMSTVQNSGSLVTFQLIWDKVTRPSRKSFNQMLFSPFLKYVILSNLSTEGFLRAYWCFTEVTLTSALTKMETMIICHGSICMYMKPS